MTTELQAAAAALPETETLRDKMAMAALTGLAWHDLDPNEDWDASYFAKRAYNLADAMMEARKK